MIVGTQISQGQRFVTSTDWDGYTGVLEAFKDRRIKITYDRGALELLSPSGTHERVKKLLARIIEDASNERGIDAVGAGSTTFRQKALEKGLEPDECYYIEHGRLPDIDAPNEDYPPPELALEVEVTQSALDRLGIYRALGISEVWRYTAKHEVVFLALGPDGYQQVERSRLLPFFTPEAISHFVKLGLGTTGLALIKELRAWLSEQP